MTNAISRPHLIERKDSRFIEYKYSIIEADHRMNVPA